MHAKIEKVSMFLPENVETNEDLALEFPAWTVEKIFDKTGIAQRHITDTRTFASDLATSAASKLFVEHAVRPDLFDYLILVTQSPDYFLPTTACIVHEALGLNEACGALDVNLGCSGFVAGLGLAKGLISSGQATNVLLVTSDTYSKFINRNDRTVRTIFGDGATATWVSNRGEVSSIGEFVYGTDGKGAKHLIVPNGGLREGSSIAPKAVSENRGLELGNYDLYMDGPEIFNFTLRVAQQAVETVLARNQILEADVDLFVFHQANAFMLSHLQAKLGIEDSRFPIVMMNWGNTVSGTIPMALSQLIESNQATAGMRLMFLGFGVGLSWAGVMVTI